MIVLINRIRTAEAAAMPGSSALSEAAARGLFKLMAYKDEYEVARLYTDGRFEKAIQETFADGGKVKIHLAPPLLARKNERGELVKRPYGPWMFTAFRWLARFKGLRGTALDLFGRTEERRMERALIQHYEARIDELLGLLAPDTLKLSTGQGIQTPMLEVINFAFPQCHIHSVVVTGTVAP